MESTLAQKEPYEGKQACTSSIAPLTALGKIAILVLFVAAGQDARLAVLDEEFIHALFGLLEALLAGAGQLDAALKRGKRLFQTLFASLHFFNDLLKLGESGFEVGQGGFFGDGGSRGLRAVRTLGQGGGPRSW